MKKLIFLVVALTTFGAFAQKEIKIVIDTTYISHKKLQVSTGYGFSEYVVFAKNNPLPGTTADHTSDNMYNETNGTSFYAGAEYRYNMKQGLVYLSTRFDYTYSYFGKINYEDLKNSTSVENVNANVYTLTEIIHCPPRFINTRRWDIYLGVGVNHIRYNFNYVGNPENVKENYWTFASSLGASYFFIKDFIGVNFEWAWGMPVESKIGLVARF